MTKTLNFIIGHLFKSLIFHSISTSGLEKFGALKTCSLDRVQNKYLQKYIESIIRKSLKFYHDCPPHPRPAFEIAGSAPGALSSIFADFKEYESFSDIPI